MPNEQLYRELQNLERKIQLVINENNKLKEDLHKTREEKDLLKAKMESQQANLDTFQNKMKISKLVDNMIVSEGNATELKSRIDEYIKEIDKCITHLAE